MRRPSPSTAPAKSPSGSSRGEARRVVPKHTLGDVVKQYLDVQRNRGRASKTLVKYR